MDKNQSPTKDDLERARLAVMNKLERYPSMAGEWAREQAAVEIRADRDEAKIAEYKRTYRRDPDRHELAQLNSGSYLVEHHAVDERVLRDYSGLLARAIERMVARLAASYGPAREREAREREAKRARNTCPVCRVESKWGHRSRRLTESNIAGVGVIDSCLPCFLTAQQVWLEITNEGVPSRVNAVRAVVESIIR